VRPDAENAERVLQALKAFGAPLAQISADDFTQPEVVFQIGVSPRRIDILTSIDGVDFAEAWPERVEITVEKLMIAVISRRHLIQNKRAVGRPQDEADIDHLERGNDT
jgi:hypothetical protein